MERASTVFRRASFTGQALLPILVVLLLSTFNSSQAGSRQASSGRKLPALVVTTEPNAMIWIDEIRRGNTDSSGKLELFKLAPGRHTLRVRAVGFKESLTPLLAGRKSIAVKLTETTDKSELLFQQAEVAREQARDNDGREKAADLYRQAIQLKAAMPAAHIGLARVYMDQNQLDNAHDEIAAARRYKPLYAEASAIEGRIFREGAQDEDAIRSFRRAITEGKGFQPEAHVGLARLYEDKNRFADAILELRKALDQLSDSEPVIYQMLGAAYEKAEKPKEAVAAYEKYLDLAPNGSYASAIRSILTQLKREAGGGEEIIP